MDNIDLTSLRQGDRIQWERFVDCSAPLLAMVIRKTLQEAGVDDSATSDLLQDVYLRLCRDHFSALARYQPKRSRLSTWLAVIARNITVDYLRRKRPEPVELNWNVSGRSDCPREERLEISFQDLPPRQMLIMRLLYEKDMDVREVADFMGISEQTVRSGRHKAINRLRQIYKKKSKGIKE